MVVEVGVSWVRLYVGLTHKLLDWTTLSCHFTWSKVDMEKVPLPLGGMSNGRMLWNLKHL